MANHRSGCCQRERPVFVLDLFCITNSFGWST
jgi:hypothetical protein